MARPQSSYHSVHWETSAETRFLALVIPLILGAVFGWLMYYNTRMPFLGFPLLIILIVVGVSIGEWWCLTSCFSKLEVSPEGIKYSQSPFGSKFISWQSVHHVEPSKTGDPTVYNIFATDTKIYPFKNSCLFFDQLMEAFRSRNILITPKERQNLDRKMIDNADNSEKSSFLSAFPGNHIPTFPVYFRGSLFWLSFFLMLLSITTPMYFFRVLKHANAMDAIMVILLDVIFIGCGVQVFRAARNSYIVLQAYGVDYPTILGSRKFTPWSEIPYARFFDSNPLGAHNPPSIKLFSKSKQDYIFQVNASVPAYFALLIEMQEMKVPLLKETEVFHPKDENQNDNFAFVNQE